MKIRETILAIVFNSLLIPSYANLTVDVTPASGPYASDGAIDLTVTGGFSPYEFAWSDGNTIFSNSEDVSDLPPGLYTVGVTDALCGMASLEVEVGYDCQLEVSTITPICICEYGGAEYEVTGGSGDYTYFWELTGEQFVITHNEPYPKFIGYESITELPDTYILTVTDGNGCQATASMTIDTCSGLKLAALRERIKISPYIVLGSGPTGA